MSNLFLIIVQAADNSHAKLILSRLTRQLTADAILGEIFYLRS